MKPFSLVVLGVACLGQSPAVIESTEQHEQSASIVEKFEHMSNQFGIESDIFVFKAKRYARKEFVNGKSFIVRPWEWIRKRLLQEKQRGLVCYAAQFQNLGLGMQEMLASEVAEANNEDLFSIPSGLNPGY